MDAGGGWGVGGGGWEVEGGRWNRVNRRKGGTVNAIHGQNIKSHVTRHTSPALHPATNRVTRARRRSKLDLHRRLQQRHKAAPSYRLNSTLTFCPAGTVPLPGSAVNPSALASAGTSKANSPGSFAPQLPTTTSEAAAAPVLSPTTRRSVFVVPAGARCERERWT